MSKILIDRSTVEQALEALEYHVEQTRPIWKTSEAIAALEAALAEPVLQAALRAALAQPVQEPQCNPHPKAPHGFLRNASHTEGRYVCECEYWSEPVQEPVAKVELMTTGGNAGLATRISEIDDHLRERLRPGQLLYTATPQQAEPVEQTCTWQQDGDSDSGLYAASCGRYFNLEDGTPEDNKMAWCCYCGKKLAQELITENKDD